MPQLDPTTFVPQLFWLMVTFVLLYLVMWKIAIPRIGDVLQDRQKRIDSDLEKAEELKKEAQSVREAYEKLVTNGSNKAQETIRVAREKVAADALAQHASLTEKITVQTSEAENRISAAKNQALADIRTVAVEATQLAASKLIDQKISETEVEAAVSKILDKERRS
jgi:F-type H+-transporting ATPase subunit b